MYLYVSNNAQPSLVNATIPGRLRSLHTNGEVGVKHYSPSVHNAQCYSNAGLGKA